MLKVLFPDADEQALSFGFSPVHRIVLDLQPGTSLEFFLRQGGQRRYLDAADDFGQTPLWWAARRGDVASAQTLLIAGADPNRVNASGNGPLYAAAQSRSARVITLLLLANADVLARNMWGYQAVHAAAMCCDDPACLAPFFTTAELDVDTPTPDGDTPLQRCARYDNARAGAYLIGLGANINNVNRHGETPLVETVLRGNHAMMRLLLRHTGRLDLGTVNRYGATVFHTIALHASVETLAVLGECHWGGAARHLDLSRKDTKGRTVLDVLKDRVLDKKEKEKIRAAFVRLIEKIEDEETSHSSLDQFFDAQMEAELTLAELDKAETVVAPG
jgi:ankyrin repeat protein